MDRIEALENLMERLECIWIEMNDAWDAEDVQGALRIAERFRDELEAHNILNRRSVKNDSSKVA